MVLVPGVLAAIVEMVGLVSFWAFGTMPAAYIWWAATSAVPLTLGIYGYRHLQKQWREHEAWVRTWR